MLGQKVASLTTVTGNGTEDSSQTERSPPKQPRTEFMESFSEILEEAGVDCSGNESEVSRYLSEPLIDFHIHDTEPDYLCWWANNKMRFPVLVKLAPLYLSAPPTLVPSEILFSTAGDIYDEKHNRLLSEKAETLLFIKHNFYWVGGCYVNVFDL